MSSSPANKTALPTLWETHKFTIQHLYITEKKTREEVRKIMRDSYDFFATKSQYERHFKEWGFRKHLRGDDWMALESRLLKRKRDGKESDVYIDGKLVSPKKIRKEIGRACPGLAVERYPQAPSPQLPCGVVVSTPGPSILPLFVLRDLPYFQFETLFGAQSGWLPAPYGSDTPEISLFPSTTTAVYTGPFRALNLTQADHSHFKDIRSGIVKEICKTSDDGPIEGGPALISAVQGIMPDLVPEGCSSSWMLAASNPQDAGSQLLKFTLFLLSNNFLSERVDLTQNIIAWLKTCGNIQLLELLLSAKGPAFESLAENLFRSTIESQDVQILKALLSAGLDPNEQVCLDDFESPCSALQRACELDDLALVRALIEAGANINQTYPLGKSPLEMVFFNYWEEKEGNKELALYLIQNGAEANQRDNDGRTPLIIAASNRELQLVEALLHAGANVNQKDNWGATALLYATARSHFEMEFFVDIATPIAIIRVLLQAGAEVHTLIKQDDYDDPSGTTVLERAAKWGSTELCEQLLNAGAPISDGTLCFATMSNNIELVRMLLHAGLNVNHILRGGQYALKEAIENKNEELVRILLTSGANVNPKVDIGRHARVRTPLQAASSCSDVNLVKMLVDLGAQVNAKAPTSNESLIRGRTALEEVAASGNASLVKFLLDVGADVISSPQILSHAIEGRNAAVVHMILDEGAEVNPCPSSRKPSPLEAASTWGDLAIVRRLLEAGANHRGALVHAIRSGHLEVIQVLLEAGATDGLALPQAVKSGHSGIIQILLDAGACIDGPDERDRGLQQSALTIAIQKRDMKTVYLLLKAGVDVNHPLDKFGKETALEAATRNGDLHLVQSLLRAGANPDDPQALLAGVETPESLFIVRTLLAARSGVHGQTGTRYGCTALQRAIRNKDAKLVKILLCAGVDSNAFTMPTYHQDKRYSLESIRFGETALGTAILEDRQKSFPIVREILNAGADPNSVVSQPLCLTALLVSIEKQNSELVQLLIDAGANVNTIATKKSQRTALQAAAEKGNLAIVQILLKARANVNALPAADGGATALQLSAIGGYVGIAYILINEGAEVNALRAKKNGRTALEGAAEYGRIDMLQMLLDAGAELEGPGEEQYNRALYLASKNGHNAARRLLQAHRALQSVKSDTQVADKVNEEMSFHSSETGNVPEPSFTLPELRDLHLPTTLGLECLDFDDLSFADISDFHLPDMNSQMTPKISDFDM